MAYTIRALREADFATISARVDGWWGRPVQNSLQRLFFQHFQSMSRVAEQDGDIVGFIVGFQSETATSVSYAHFIAVAPDFRRQGIARALYENFLAEARARGCTSVEAVTGAIVASGAVNMRSVSFHRSLGFEILPGDASVEGVAVSLNHDGPGQDRVRMLRAL